MNPEPVQARLPVLLGATTPAGVDEVFVSDRAAADLDTELRLLEGLRAVVGGG